MGAPGICSSRRTLTAMAHSHGRGCQWVWAHQNRELLLQIAEHKRPITGLVVDNTTEAIVHGQGGRVA